MDNAKELLDENNISYVHKRKSLRITTDEKAIKNNPELFKNIAEIVNNYWKK